MTPRNRYVLESCLVPDNAHIHVRRSPAMSAQRLARKPRSPTTMSMRSTTTITLRITSITAKETTPMILEVVEEKMEGEVVSYRVFY